MPAFGGLRGKVHGSSMARWKARGRLPISASWTFFASSYGWGAMSKYWSKLRCLKGEWVTLSAILGGMGSSTNEFWRQKTRVPKLSRGVACVILCLAVLMQYRRVRHTHTNRERERERETRSWLLPAGKNVADKFKNVSFDRVEPSIRWLQSWEEVVFVEVRDYRRSIIVDINVRLAGSFSRLLDRH